VLWKPVWNLLEGRFTLLLVNPRHLKKVPGRKTDVSDAEWQEASAAGARPHVTRNHLPRPEEPQGVPRPGTDLLPSTGAGTYATLSGQTPATPRLQRDAVPGLVRRPRRVNDPAHRFPGAPSSGLADSPCAPAAGPPRIFGAENHQLLSEAFFYQPSIYAPSRIVRHPFSGHTPQATP